MSRTRHTGEGRYPVIINSYKNLDPGLRRGDDFLRGRQFLLLLILATIPDSNRY